MGRKFGMSFSLKRAVGISGAKQRIARKTGIPLTRQGRQRKVGRMFGCALPSLIVVAAITFIYFLILG